MIFTCVTFVFFTILVAVISYVKCIKCFCCHEMCPAKAIDIKRFSLFRLMSGSLKK